MSLVKFKLAGLMLLAAPCLLPVTADEAPGDQSAAPKEVKLSPEALALLSSPEMKESSLRSIEQNHKRQWQTFVASLDQGVQELFATKMLEYTRKSGEQTMSFLTKGKATPEDLTRLMTSKMALDNEVYKILGTEDYGRYQAYEKALPARQQLIIYEDHGFKLEDANHAEPFVEAIVQVAREQSGGAVPVSLLNTGFCSAFVQVSSQQYGGAGFYSALRERASSLLTQTELASLDTALAGLKPTPAAEAAQAQVQVQLGIQAH